VVGCVSGAVGATKVDGSWSATVTGVAGGSDFAPYYIASNRHGELTQGCDALLRVGAAVWSRVGNRFSYSFGADVMGGYASPTDYLRWIPATGTADSHAVSVARHPARAWIQQLYGRADYRGVFLCAGLREHSSALLDGRLSSGDIVESGNARPIPEVRVGFNDFQNIPFTGGWVQIQGEISYGKLTDNGWMKQHFNYYTGHLNLGALYTYKRCYFRTRPAEPFSVTVGMQVGAFFGGETTWYTRGAIVQHRKFSSGIKQFFKMLLPTDGGADYYSGSSLGSWDLMGRYRFSDGTTVKAYMQKPFEDGSGIGFLNGFDGLWGLECRFRPGAVVSGLVVEYLDFTNQSGPIHWDPDDETGTDITARAEGNDNYYNNYEYNSYAYYGMSIGTPF
ncbi:MAG: capsule assembly Wzi family protein, partial [Muribaculaceae bacterium]|nr:capsule assembly Wzi family protein [Muribaculaceae bacterium]